MTPRSYAFEGELTQWVDKANDVGLIIWQLPIKAGWWNTPLMLRDVSWSNKQTIFFSNKF